MYFSQDYTPHDHRFLSALAQTEHQVHYLRLEDGGGRSEARPIPAGVEPVDWWGGRRRVRWYEYARARRELRRVLERVRPELVHGGPIQGPALLTAMAGFRPLLSMSWGSDLLVGARRGAGKWAARYALARSSGLACDSHAVRERAIALGMPAGDIVVFPWGVDLEHFSPEPDGGLRRRLGWEDGLVLLSTRAWEPLLGVDDLVSGFCAAAQRIPELRLLLLGSGSLEPEIKGIVQSLGLQDRVHFAGQVGHARLPDYYRSADVYLSASHSDGSSVSLLEAMACGLPALVSDIPGNREWVVTERSGWWFRDRDVGDLAELLQFVAGRRGDFPDFGRRARQIVEARANWSENFPLLLQAYERAVS